MALSRRGRKVFWTGAVASMALFSVCVAYYLMPEYRQQIEEYTYNEEGWWVSLPQPLQGFTRLFLFVNLPAVLAFGFTAHFVLPLLDLEAVTKARLLFWSKAPISLIWWYVLGLATTWIGRAIERRRAVRDPSRCDTASERSERRPKRSWKLSRIGWLVFLVGFAPSMVFLGKMAVYHVQPEHREWLDEYYSWLNQSVPAREYVVASERFFHLNLPAEIVGVVLLEFTTFLFGTPDEWRADIVLPGRAVFSLLWWYLLGLTATAIQRALARRQAARDPSSAAAPNDGSGDAG